jgi:hypothetical protein
MACDRSSSFSPGIVGRGDLVGLVTGPRSLTPRGDAHFSHPGEFQERPAGFDYGTPSASGGNCG